ncbi:hypothetical protein F66182_7842 [Fusarium sp. NRRL 66182]|nr:hypothetical protein F66182_7842 [Fusarium sp. NRRL 66182]
MLFMILLALPLALAAPLNPRTAGEITYYHPGLGACGDNHGDGDMVAAVSAAIFDADRPCGKTVKVKGDAGETTVTVVDRCADCPEFDIDLSPTAFKKAVGALSVGRGKGSWSFE